MYEISACCVIVVPKTQGDFKLELSDILVTENERVIIRFTTSKKAPDLSHKMLNGTEYKLVANGICMPTTKAYGWGECNVTRVSGGGYSVTMSCPAANARLAGTYTGTDNDDAVNARKTKADLVVVAGKSTGCVTVERLNGYTLYSNTVLTFLLSYMLFSN